MKRLSLCIALAMLVVPLSSRAWDREGHALIAQLAQKQLTPAARLEVDRLLSLEPGATMASVSSWADEHRSPKTARWHFVNFPRGTCEYDASRDCEGGQCVVAAIEQQADVLATSVDDGTRLRALKYLVHFVADVHQPLHAGYADDKGGNKFQVQAFGHGSNLHRVWDHDLVANRAGGAEQLLRELTPRSGAPMHEAFLPSKWAEESCRAVADDRFYPAGHVLPEDYGQVNDAALKDRMAKASRRLASILNSVMR